MCTRFRAAFYRTPALWQHFNLLNQGAPFTAATLAGKLQLLQRVAPLVTSFALIDRSAVSPRHDCLEMELLESLPATLQQLTCRSRQVSIGDLAAAMQRCTALHRLGLGAVQGLPIDLLSLCHHASRLRQLSQLSLEWRASDGAVRSVSVDPLRRLPLLQSLHVSASPGPLLLPELSSMPALVEFELSSPETIQVCWHVGWPVSQAHPVWCWSTCSYDNSRATSSSGLYWGNASLHNSNFYGTSCHADPGRRSSQQVHQAPAQL